MHSSSEDRRYVPAGGTLRSGALRQRRPGHRERRNRFGRGELPHVRHSGKRTGSGRIPHYQRKLDGPLRRDPDGSEKTLYPRTEAFRPETRNPGDSGQYGRGDAGAGVRITAGCPRRCRRVCPFPDFRRGFGPPSCPGRYPADRNGKTGHSCAGPEIFKVPAGSECGRRGRSLPASGGRPCRTRGCAR